MTIQPVAPLHLLTVAEYLAIGEIEPGEVIRASEVHVIVEVLSPGSKRTDNVLKRSEYADAGIPHYWIVDIEPPVSLLACHLAGEFGYADSGTATGTFAATAPFLVEIDLDALL
jgi:putative restriction endonuclease